MVAATTWKALSQRAEELKQDMSPEELYSRLFAPVEVPQEDFCYPPLNWERGPVIKMSKRKAAEQKKKIKAYNAYMHRSLDLYLRGTQNLMKFDKCVQLADLFISFRDHLIISENVIESIDEICNSHLKL